MNDLLVDKCQRAAFINLDGEFLRVVAFDDEDEILFVENEDSGEDYRLEESDLEGAKFFELQEIG